LSLVLLKDLLLPTPLPDLAPLDLAQLPLLPRALVSASPLAAACLSASEALRPVLVDRHPQEALDSPLAASLVLLLLASLGVEAPLADPVSTPMCRDYLGLKLTGSFLAGFAPPPGFAPQGGPRKFATE
jgi:hypothetical protein